MNLILADYLGRRWWLVLYAALAYAFFLYVLQRDESCYMLAGCVITLFAAIFFCGEFGPTSGFPVLRTLPLSSRELGRTYWWAVVGCPGLAMLTMAIPVFLYTGWSRGREIPIFMVLERTLPAIILSGAIFLGSFAMPTISSGEGVWTWSKSVWCWLLRLTLWPVPFYFADFFPANSPQRILFMILCALATWAGWADAESFVEWWADLGTGPGSKQRQVSKSLTVPHGRGGLPLLLRCMVKNAAVWSLAFGMLLFLIPGAGVFFGWIHGPHQGQDHVRAVMMLSILSTVIVSTPRPQVRFLRTIPISSLTLAAFLVLTASIGMYLVWSTAAILWVVFLPHDAFLNEQQTVIVAAICSITVAISVPVQMYHLPREFLATIAFAGFAGLPAVAGYLEGLFAPPVSGAIVLGLILGSIVATRLLLERSDRPYLGGTFGGASITWTKEPK